MTILMVCFSEILESGNDMSGYLNPSCPSLGGGGGGRGEEGRGSCECKFSITIDKDNTDIPVLRETGARKTAHLEQALAAEV